MDSGKCAYLKYAEEVGDDGNTPHFQGYFVLDKEKCGRKYLAGVKKLLGQEGEEVHLEQMQGTIEDNDEYTEKEGGPVHEYGSREGITGGPKKKKDLVSKKIMDMVKEGKDDLEIMETEPSAFYHQRAMDAFRFKIQAKEARKWRDVRVEVYWGPTGTGKTRHCKEECGGQESESWYLIHLSLPEWWDEYDPNVHTDCIIDDLHEDQVSIVRLLALLYGDPCRLPIKGGFTWAMWTRVFITSNADPTTWFPQATAEHRAALMRRIDHIEHMDVNQDSDQDMQ